MGRLLNIVTPLHKATKREYLARMVDEKVKCMIKAKEYDADYWDGDRRYGYGGYKFLPGRWKPVAEALIKTSKGNITVELFEDMARNTVSNFVALAESGFYNKDSKGGKQKLFGLMKDKAGNSVLIQTGSPNNDFDGGPGYHIADEPNAKKHVKGALAMVLQQDEESRTLVPNSAGSQFFICLTDIPAYDFQERKFTVFGQVTGGLDVLDKLQDGDVLEGIEIPKKKDHPYTVNKIPTP